LLSIGSVCERGHMQAHAKACTILMQALCMSHAWRGS